MIRCPKRMVSTPDGVGVSLMIHSTFGLSVLDKDINALIIIILKTNEYFRKTKLDEIIRISVS